MAEVSVYELAQLAKAVYNFREYETAKLLSEKQYTYVKFYDQGETQAFLAYKPGVRVVCFRGTSMNLMDVVRDINFFYKLLAKIGLDTDLEPATEGELYKDYKAHAGFVRSLNQIWGYKWGDFGSIKVDWTDHPKMANDIDPEFKPKKDRELCPGDTPIIFTGHSLGAALAAAGAFRAYAQGVQGIRVVGFGTPRFASWHLAQKFNQSINFVRIMNGNDIINYFPPTPNLRQCGPRIRIGKRVPFTPVKDHGMANYVRILKDHPLGAKNVLQDEHIKSPFLASETLLA